jgi:hypothetical protein
MIGGGSYTFGLYCLNCVYYFSCHDNDDNDVTKKGEIMFTPLTFQTITYRLNQLSVGQGVAITKIWAKYH